MPKLPTHPGHPPRQAEPGRSPAARSPLPRGSRLKSMQAQIILYVMLFLIVPFCLAFYLLDRPLVGTIERKIGSSMQDSLSSVSQNIEGLFLNMQNALTVVVMDQNIISMTKNPGQFSDNERYRIADNVIRTLNSTYLYRTENYVSILDFHGGLYTSWYAPPGTYAALAAKPWHTQAVRAAGSFVWLDRFDNYTAGDKRPLISVAALIADFKSVEGSGIVLVSAVEADLRKAFEGLDGDYFIVDGGGMVISHSDKRLLGSNLSGQSYIRDVLAQDRGQLILDRPNEGGDKTIVNFRTLPLTGWKLIHTVPYDAVFKEINQIRRTNFLILGVILAVFIGITVTISARITGPLKLLSRKMTTLEEKEFAGTLAVKGTSEVAGLIHTFNEMVRRIRELLNKLKAEYEQKEEMRFRLLQSQIKPHFILNTLNNIKWMAYIKQANEVGEMVSSLGAILEASIGRDEDFIPLRRELEYIRNYVILQKLKYNEKLQLEIDVDERLLDCRVIKFLLQPIVENSIYHGIDQKAGTGTIRIAARATERGELAIAVADDGLGMSGEALQALRDKLEEPPDRPSASVGLRNIHQRIRLHYGEAYGLSVESEEGSGTLVELRLPYQATEEGGGHV